MKKPTSMSLKFEGETLTIGGEGPVTGTVVINVRITDGRFVHYFGTDGGDEVEFTPDGFVADGDSRCELHGLERALWDWIDSNERRIEKALYRQARL